MDILKKYNVDNPTVRPQVPQWEPSGEYGAITRLVMRFSGGRIREQRQANIFLVIVVVAIFGISFLIVINQGERTQSLLPEKIISLPGQPPRLSPVDVPQ